MTTAFQQSTFHYQERFCFWGAWAVTATAKTVWRRHWRRVHVFLPPLLQYCCFVVLCVLGRWLRYAATLIMSVTFHLALDFTSGASTLGGDHEGRSGTDQRVPLATRLHTLHAQVRSLGDVFTAIQTKRYRIMPGCQRPPSFSCLRRGNWPRRAVTPPVSRTCFRSSRPFLRHRLAMYQYVCANVCHVYLYSTE